MYNQKMGGVDVFDQKRCTFYGLGMKGRRRKWTVRLFEALIDMAITNAFVVWERMHAKQSPLHKGHFEFILAAHSELLNIGQKSRCATRRSLQTLAEADVRTHIVERAYKKARKGTRLSSSHTC